LANRLDKILHAALNPISAKSYVGDLKNESLSNQSINDDFRFIADDYLLYSFFETQPTKPLGEIVVGKDSACIGGPKNEITQMMEANHRSICKFDDVEDPNYEIIRDHLITIIDDVVGDGMFK
jgi:hypothetical protein